MYMIIPLSVSRKQCYCFWVRRRAFFFPSTIFSRPGTTRNNNAEAQSARQGPAPPKIIAGPQTHSPYKRMYSGNRQLFPRQ